MTAVQGVVIHSFKTAGIQPMLDIINEIFGSGFSSAPNGMVTDIDHNVC
jgi:hypothetical protein